MRSSDFYAVDDNSTPKVTKEFFKDDRKGLLNLLDDLKPGAIVLEGTRGAGKTTLSNFLADEGWTTIQAFGPRKESNLTRYELTYTQSAFWTWGSLKSFKIAGADKVMFDRSFPSVDYFQTLNRSQRQLARKLMSEHNTLIIFVRPAFIPGPSHIPGVDFSTLTSQYANMDEFTDERQGLKSLIMEEYLHPKWGYDGIKLVEYSVL